MHPSNSMMRDNIGPRPSPEWLLGTEKSPMHDSSIYGTLGKQMYPQAMMQNYKAIRCKVSHCTLCGNTFAQSLFHKDPGRPSASEKHCESCRKEIILRNYHRPHRSQPPPTHMHSPHLPTNLSQLSQRMSQNSCCNNSNGSTNNNNNTNSNGQNNNPNRRHNISNPNNRNGVGDSSMGISLGNPLPSKTVQQLPPLDNTPSPPPHPTPPTSTTTALPPPPSSSLSSTPSPISQVMMPVAQSSSKPSPFPSKFFHCDICGRAFALIGNMQKHRKLHSGEKPFSCEVCGKTFGLRGNLQKHRIIHTGEKLFQCNVCGKAFALRGNMEKHKIIHTGLKPFSCEICGKEFSLRGNLQKHKIIHLSDSVRNISSRKPFHCDICGKNFSQNHTLQSHLQSIHGSDTCQVSCPS